MLPGMLRDNIVKVQASVKKLPLECKMVEAENLHICLSFLGEVEDGKIQQLREKLDEICRGYRKFNVVLGGIKFIPNERYFRVLAFDCQGDLLQNLGKDIEKWVGGDAKPPHVTLCRIKHIMKRDDVIRGVAEIGANVGKFDVSSVQIVKSELERDGPKYTVLHESSLS